MPLSIGVIPPPPPPPAPQIDVVRANWVAPDGTAWELMGPHEQFGWLTTPGIAGWGAAPITIVTDPLARGGVEVRHIRTEPRRITWPLNVYGATHTQFLARYRNLMRAFTQTSRFRRPGVLTVRRPTGQARSIEGYYEDGFGGEGGENAWHANPVLTLFCPDGYWRDTVVERVTRAYGSETATPYLDPYITVSSSQVLGQTTITNSGDVDTWPVWTITGPTTAVTATSNTLDASWTITFNLDAGETITVDTGSVRPTIRGPAGENLSGALDWPDAVLWPLVPGANDVGLLMEGAGEGSVIELAFYRRYETA
ncbi:phage tail family protein [Plantactinospora sp. S1510]|uniref:Phage tail family protein n=1 Tax=Plantactinospora alkalitolerans TaxID=2789879 RepID=A0ABS0HA80_9ACTN|nr:phage tail domain-containing protein [Plantactinospora alkalitolerans]MBF9135330.1 phage tail family protein [Plantactinospora alkalitolerans]